VSSDALEQLRFREHRCGVRDPLEAQPGALGDLEQRVLAVALVQHPEHRELGAAVVGALGERAVHAHGRAQFFTYASGT